MSPGIGGSVRVLRVPIPHNTVGSVWYSRHVFLASHEGQSNHAASLSTGRSDDSAAVERAQRANNCALVFVSILPLSISSVEKPS